MTITVKLKKNDLVGQGQIKITQIVGMVIIVGLSKY